MCYESRLLVFDNKLFFFCRHNICNNQYCKNNYYSNAISDVRWKRQRSVNPIQFYQNSNQRRWNAPVEFARPPYEMPPPPARRKYLQRSLTSSEILAPTYRYMSTIPNAKLTKNSFCNSNKSVHAYETHTLPAAYHSKQDVNSSRTVTNEVSDADADAVNRPIRCTGAIYEYITVFKTFQLFT